MKPMLFLAAAAAMSSAVPASADNGQRFDHAAQMNAYSNVLPRDHARACFDGRFIAGANRSGPNILYVQSPKGAIFRLRLASNCPALDDAHKLTMRSDGGDLICSGDPAETIAWTAAGSRRCYVNEVHWLNPGERLALATAVGR
ncbi:hypothetical protein [Caulobacter sp. Root1455]|uniref:hypothetical protein n=1 Tax=Caulobacter sp. Root1455 TaxID=1736465 RepID=UPI000AE855DA|nr:hypothetical protein [Caulobacter sp. Root1455]